MKTKKSAVTLMVSLLFLLAVGPALAVGLPPASDLTIPNSISKITADEAKKSETSNNQITVTDISGSQEIQRDDLVALYSQRDADVEVRNDTDIDNASAIDNMTADYASEVDLMAYGSIYESEPNFPEPSADNILLNYNVYGTITDVYYDMDYYRLQISDSGTLYILGKWLGDYANIGWDDDLAIGLLDSNFNYLGWCLYGQTSSGDTYVDMVDYVSPGTYYLVVFQNTDYQYLYTGEPYGFIANMINLSVTYSGNGNTGGTVPVDSTYYWQGDTVTVSSNTGSLTKTGYVFSGWNTRADGGGTSYTPGSTFGIGPTNVTLYAKWTPNPTYTVTYNGNGNTGGSVPVDSNTYTQGATVTVRGNTGSLTKTGYAFAGWNTAANGTGADYGAGTIFSMGSANVTLYAKWAGTDNIAAFVTRFYQQCLNRDPDQAGLDYWVDKLVSGEQTGADVAQGFVFSNEFVGLGVSNEAYLDVLYSAFFNREPDTGGYDYWLGQLNGGTSRLVVLAGFVNANEFQTLCANYGISPGTIDTSDEQVAAFVARFYQECLGRQPDEAGLDYWVDQLTGGTKTGADVAYGFVYSDEFQARLLSNDEYLDVLFTAFFNRDPDSGGLAYWLGQIDGGASRLQVLAGFVNSDEFATLCSEYGIVAGTITI